MLEYLAPGFLYSLLKDAVGVMRRGNKRLTKSEILALRLKWKPEIEAKLRERRRDKTGLDVIMRDVKRINEYPETTNKKGISPWFRCGLVGTYHRGVLLLLSWEGLTQDSNKKWHRTNYQEREKETLTAALIGYVLYENIEKIDWEGDEFYSKSQLYCHFNGRKGQPYERIAYCEQRHLDHSEYYHELAGYEDVTKPHKKKRAF